MKPVIELRCLGSLDLHDCRDDRRLHSVLAQPKRVALLLYLALARPRGFHSSEKLFALFWPDADTERARKALNQAVYVLRRALGNGCLQRRDDGSVAIDPDCLMCDAHRFETALEEGRPADALDLYDGPLLDGVHMADCAPFERWLDAERERLRQLAIGAGSGLVASESESGNLAGALAWALRMSGLAPYDEALLRDRLQLHERLGDRSGAVQAFERFEARLAADLDLRPSDETRALVERIVQGGATGASTGPEAPPAAPPVPVEQQAPASRPSPDRVISPERSARWRIVVAGTAAALALFVTGGWWLSQRPGAPARELASAPARDGHRVLIAPLVNETGDGSLDLLGRMAADWIGQEVAGSGVLSVVPWASALNDAPSPLLTDAATRDEAAWVQLAAATGSRYLVTGTYGRSAEGLAFHVRILDAEQGALVRGINGVEGPVGEPALLLERVRQRTSAALAWAVDPRLASWEHAAHAPPTLEAYRLFSAGMETFLGSKESSSPANSFSEAAVYFRRAAAVDSSFVTPLLWAVYAYDYGGEWRERNSVLRVVEARRERLTPFERALLDAQLAHVRGDWTGQFEAYRRAVDLVPTSEWRFNLGASALELRRYDLAVEILSGLDPDRGWISHWERYWYDLTIARHMAGEHEAELRDAEAYLERYPASAGALRQKAIALAALGRTAEALRLAQSQMDADNPMLHTAMVTFVVGELRAHGQPRAAEELLRRFLSWYDALPEERRRRAGGSALLILAGRLDEAQAMAEEGLHDTDRPPWYRWGMLSELGIVAARRGETREARRLMSEIAAQADSDSVWRAAGLVGRAAVAAQLGDASRAVSLLRAADADGWPWWPTWVHAGLMFEPIRAKPAVQEFLRGH